MNIEYEVTVEDDLNAQQTDWELRVKKGKILFVPLCYLPIYSAIIGVGSVVLGFFESAQYDRYALYTLGGLYLVSSLVLFLVFRLQDKKSPFARRQLLKRHGNYYAQRERRNIILTEREFIFKTSNSEMAWSWQALKSFREGENAFVLDFCSGHRRFISKRAFTVEQLNDFKLLVRKYQDSVA